MANYRKAWQEATKAIDKLIKDGADRHRRHR